MALPTFGLLLVILLSCTSAIRLEGNGYTGVLFAINPAIPEDPALLNRIRGMIKAASGILHGAVGQRFYFKEVTILVPANWTNGNYSRVKTETYEKANVIIDEPNKSYGDEPYTLQYGQCGQPGQYIHLTPDFLLDDKLISVYGERSKVLVHEWGHLRWGLYDEYSEEQPFYHPSNGMGFEATRCSKDIKGRLCVMTDKNTCLDCDPKTFDPITGLPLKDCVFLPRQDPKVVEFCSDETHNPEAPNQQNKMCDNRAALDVILNSSVDNGTQALSQIPQTIVNVVQRKTRIVCLVLDVSGSMQGPWIELLRQAATLFLETIIEDAAYVGIVQFESSPSVLKYLTVIDGDESRKALVQALPTRAGGGTNICPGIDKAFEVLRRDGGFTEGNELILLTDGEAGDNLGGCEARVVSSGAIVHTIALGPSADKKLPHFADITGGIFFQTSDSMNSNELIDAFASLTTSDGNVTQQTVQLESSGIRTTDWFNGTFSVDWTVGKDTISDFAHDAGIKMLSLKVPGIAETGTWHYSLLHTGSGAQSMAITVTSRAASADVPPITVKAHMDQKSSDGSKAMVVYAIVTQKGLPVIEAKVTAILESDTEKTPQSLDLQDNGANADAFRLDGIYSRYFTNFTSGRYSLKVRVENSKETKAMLAPYRHSGVLYVPGYVGVDDKVELNPPKPPVNHEPVEVGSFTRTATGESFVVTLPSGSTRPPAFPPSKITDLRAELSGEVITVKWTAPGASYDVGRAARYHIAWSEDLALLRTNFSGSHHIDPWELRPQDAGSTERYSFHPSNLNMVNGTTVFIAVVAENADSLNSSISNVERVMKYVAPPPVPEEGGSVNVIGIAVGVAVGVIAIASVVGTVICWKKR
ncbi:calcium-activated chloride channel regulator 1-like [Engraulis encrasicolus]|uniref:calcium-activated chloride channel regulator 1-like n=1 Tax=Engraulis encrasicolus TaxID=184585 RepID=UPI002FD161C2